MKPPPLLHVHPHRGGPWLVVHGRRRLAVPPELGRRLLELDGGRPGAAELAVRMGLDETVVRALLQRRARRRRGPWLRLPLLPAPLVRRPAGLLAPLTGGRGLGATALAAAALIVAVGLPAASTDAGWPAFALLAAGGLVHELGHAAALVRAGYPPGGIGAGLLLGLPVLWCDVSAVGLLGRAGRARVDLAGPVFQLAAAAVLAVAARVLPGAARQACGGAAAWSLLAVAWSLTPLFRADGFWLLTDLLGLDDLDRLPRAGDGRRTVAALACYRLAHGAVFAWLGAAALARGGPGSLRSALALAMGAALLLLVMVRTVRLAAALRRESP